MWSWLALQAGDERAFKDFAGEFGCKFERWLTWNGFRHADAVDVAEDGTVEVLLRLKQFHPEEPADRKFLAWAWRVARNFAEDWRRKNRPDIYEPLNGNTSDRSVPLALDPIEAREHFAKEAAAAESQELRLRELVNQLAEKYRQVVLLRAFDGSMTFAQIAETLKIEESAARVRYHRALKKLREIAERPVNL